MIGRKSVSRDLVFIKIVFLRNLYALNQENFLIDAADNGFPNVCFSKNRSHIETREHDDSSDMQHAGVCRTQNTLIQG